MREIRHRCKKLKSITDYYQTRQNMTERHNWSVDDDKAALKAYLDKTPAKTINVIAEGRGIKYNSFCKRMSNFQYLVTNGEKGLSKYAKQSKRVWEEYKKTGKL
jgi:hypothetical protein